MHSWRIHIIPQMLCLILRTWKLPDTTLSMMRTMMNDGSGKLHGQRRNRRATETSFTQNQLASCWPSLVCPISPPLLNGFQSSLISLESYFQGESNAVCCEGRRLLFMENVGNYRNCATRIILETIGVYPIRTYPFWRGIIVLSLLVFNCV